MNPLVHFRWYRRWRGGVWGRHSALLHPWKTWTRFDYRPDDFSERLGDEDWRALPPPNSDWEHREYARAVEAAHGIKEGT